MPERNLLLIEDNPGDARLVQELLREASASEFHVDWVDRLSTGLDRLKKGNVDVVLLDLSLPDSTGLSTYTRIVESGPPVPIVVLTGYEDQSLALEAVRQGAQDYLAKFDATPYVLARSVRYAFERHNGLMARNHGMASRTGKVIGFVGAKGGVGTTTLVMNLGSVLAMQGKSAVSAELRTDLGCFSLLTRHKDPKSIRDLLTLAPEAIGKNSVSAHLYAMPSGLKVLYGPQVDRLEIPSEKSAAVIQSLSAIAEVSLLDLGSTLDAQTAMAAAQCDFVVLVLEPEPVAVLSAARALEALNRHGCNMTALGMVIVRRTALANPIKLQDIRTQLNCMLLGSVPPAPEECVVAGLAGSPVAVHLPDSIIAGSFADLAERLMASPVQELRAA